MTDFLRIFDEEYGPKLGIREPTFRAVLREAITYGSEYILETGCARQADNWLGDGQSTYIWSHFRKYRGMGTFESVDVEPAAVEYAISLVSKLEDLQYSHIYQNDSLKHLHKRKLPIDILYLDSYDLDQANPHPAALHCLMELTAAFPLLRRNSIVFVDDSPMTTANGEFITTGKGTYVGQFMNKLGIRPFTFGYQVAWKMP